MGTRLKLFCAAAGAAACMSLPAGSQTAPGTGSGVTVIFGTDSTFRFDDNLDLDRPSLGNTWRWENLWSLGIESLTRNQRLRFDIDGLTRVIDHPLTGQQFDAFENPGAAFSYSRDSANSRFTADGSYRETDLGFFQPPPEANPDGTFDERDLIDDNGARINKDLSLQLQTGINAPLGFVFELDHREVGYEDTLNTGLFDSRNTSYAVTSRLTFSPTTQGRIKLGFTDYDARDDERTQRETTELQVGLTHQFSPILSLDVAVGRTRIDETLAASGVSGSESGGSGSVTLTRLLKNGSLSLSANQSFDTLGQRSTFEITRVLALRSTNLAFSIGTTQNAQGEFFTTGRLELAHSLQRSQVSLSLARDVQTSSLDNEVQITRADLGYALTINPISNLALDVNYFENVDNGADTQRRRANFQASYNRQLTADWNLSLGYEFRSDQTDTEPAATGNAVFVTFNRQYTLKP